MDRGISHERSVGGYAAKAVAVGGTGAHDRQGRKGRRAVVVQRAGTAFRRRHVRAGAGCLGSVRGRQASPHRRPGDLPGRPPPTPLGGCPADWRGIPFGYWPTSVTASRIVRTVRRTFSPVSLTSAMSPAAQLAM